MSSQKAPEFFWDPNSDKRETLIFKGVSITLDSLRQCQGDLEDSTVQVFRQLLHGFPTADLDLSLLKDDVGKKDIGYSLFSDPRNLNVFGDGKRLVKYFLTNENLREQFTHRLPTGLQWTVAACIGWLKSYAELDLLILLQCMMSCGAPGRASELTGLALSNTPGGMQRAFHLMGKQLVLIRRYNKMRGQESSDRFIPSSLPSALASILLYKEALCRPFAIHCAALIHAGDPEVQALYHSYCFVNDNRLFTADNISSEMKKYTFKHIGMKIGVRLWRQCSAPFRREHAAEPSLTSPQTVDAYQSGHSQRVDHLRYGVTGHGSLGVSEDSLKRCLDASVRWHNVLHLVPGKVARSFYRIYAKLTLIRRIRGLFSQA